MNGIKIGCWNFPGVVNDPLSTFWLPMARVDPTWISSNGTWTGLFWFLFAIKLIWDWYETLFCVLLFRDYYVLFTFSFWKCSFLKVLFKWPCVTSQITCNLQITPSKLVMISLVIILAIFLRRKRSFIQRMRLMSLQMRWMRRNANPTTKQHSVIRVRRLSESSFSSVCTSFLTAGLSLNFRVIRLGPPFRIPGLSSLGKPYGGSVSPPVFGSEYPVKVHNVRLRRH